MRKPVLLVCLLIVLGLLVAGLAFDPTRTGIGYLRGETFFEGRPTSYWGSALVSDPATRSDAIAKLQKPDESSVEVLVALVEDKSTAPEVRWTAAELLGKMGSAAEEAGPTLLAALHDPDPHVVAVAAAALPKVGVPAEEAVPALIEMLRDPYYVIAARALSEYKGDALPALDALVKVLEDKSLDVEARWNAARTLGKLGPAGADAIPVLTAHLKDEEATVREHSAEALGDIGPAAENVVAELVAVFSDPAVRVRRDSVRSLGQIGGKARDAIPEIEKLLEDPETIVQKAASDALRKLDPEHFPPESESEESPEAPAGEPPADEPPAATEEPTGDDAPVETDGEPAPPTDEPAAE